MMCRSDWQNGGPSSLTLLNGLRPQLRQTSEDFRFIFLREAQEKNKQKIRSHLGPIPQVSGRLCEAKPDAKSPWSDTHSEVDMGGRPMLKFKFKFKGYRAI